MLDAFSLPTPPKNQSLEHMLLEKASAWRKATTDLTGILAGSPEDKKLLFYLIYLACSSKLYLEYKVPNINQGDYLHHKNKDAHFTVLNQILCSK